MRRQDLNYGVSFLLLLSVVLTGLTGYIQSQLELRRFIPHRWFAYITLGLAAGHVYLNAGKLWRYARRGQRTEDRPPTKTFGGRGQKTENSDI